VIWLGNTSGIFPTDPEAGVIYTRDGKSLIVLPPRKIERQDEYKPCRELLKIMQSN